jgi:hypothetical protein
VTIQGDAVVGATLQAIADVTGDPVPAVGYEWARCDLKKPKKGGGCATLAGATSGTYTVVDADAGYRLMVRVTATNSAGPGEYLDSAPTAVVPWPPPPNPPPPPPSSESPPPASAPAPSPAPTPPVAPTTTTPATTPGAPALVSPYLSPFPVIRIKGASVAGGAIIRLLSVSAPRRAAVKVTCAGTRCPLRRLSARTGRIRPLERYLPAGLAITIRVTRPGYIGKYVRFIVRSRAAPERHDACLLPGSSRPRRCPA